MADALKGVLFGSYLSRMPILCIAQLPMAVAANDRGSRVILPSCDVMQFKASVIAFTACPATGFLGA